jgi:iron complex transport system substrate-binding protein
MRRTHLAMLLAIVLLAGCGGTSATTTGPTGATVTPTATSGDSRFPIEIAGAVIPSRPQAIVSLSPTATETLFAIGASDQVVAVDEYSNYPEAAPTTSLSGLTPNVEALATYSPDLVVVEFDPGDLVAALEGLGVPTIVQPTAAGLEDVYRQIDELGAATGNRAAAMELIDAMKADVAAAVAVLPEVAVPLTFYHELDPSFYSVKSTTFIGELYSMMGLVDIADGAEGDGSGYPQLSPEFILEQDPDLVFLADTKCCGQTAAEVLARPGWDALTAAATGGIIELDDDIASRWGPRVVEFLQVVATAVGDHVEGDG